MKVKVGIIGGSGLSDAEIFKPLSERKVDTPFGSPSDVLIEGQIDGVDCVLLARHGRKHSIYPTGVNYRANIYALKRLNCTHIIVSTACGSLKEEIQPGDFVILDQFIDRTTKRITTFYDGSNEEFKGILHLPMDTPFCPKTSSILKEACKSLGVKAHEKGTMITSEGPHFGTKAESWMFKQWGGDTVNMTTVPEVILARELGLCYASIAIATDYDCWKENHEAVGVELVLATFKSSTQKVMDVLRKSISLIDAEDWTEYIDDMQKNVKKNIMLQH